MTQIPGKTQRKSQFDPKFFFSALVQLCGACGPDSTDWWHSHWCNYAWHVDQTVRSDDIATGAIMRGMRTRQYGLMTWWLGAENGRLLTSFTSYIVTGSNSSTRPMSLVNRFNICPEVQAFNYYKTNNVTSTRITTLAGVKASLQDIAVVNGKETTHIDKSILQMMRILFRKSQKYWKAAAARLESFII